MDLKKLFGRTRFCKAPAIALALSVAFLNGCLDIPDTPDAPPEIEHISVYVEQEGIKDSSILKIFPGDSATLKVSVFPRQYKKDFSFEWKRSGRTLGTGESYVIAPKAPARDIPTLLAVYDPLGGETTVSFNVIANTPPQLDSIVSPAAGDTIYGNASMAILFKWYASDKDLNYSELPSTYPDINWKEGRRLNGISDADLRTWVQSFVGTTTQKMYLTIGGVTKTATMVSNSSTEALVAQLQQGNITYEAHDYGNFEKVGPLGYTFPENNEQINTVPGDLILYQGSNLCIYYDTNSWNFTRIGKLDNMTQADIKTWVNAGGDNVTVTLSITDKADEASSISQVRTDESQSNDYTLQGTLAQAGYKGIIIKKGKKVIK